MSSLLNVFEQMSRTLRLFLSHTVSGQRWQTGDTGGMDPGNVNLETGEGLPAWQFKIEGRLLEVSCIRIVAFLILTVPLAA
jgi:hypothetical protein